MRKKLWRCHVCGDIHYGDFPPAVCPTCGQRNAFVEIDFDEALKILDIGRQGNETRFDGPEAVQRSWKEFAELRQFLTMADEEEIKMLCQGVMENLKSKGLKFCPCRITSGDPVKDLDLICPCSFIKQKNWTEIGECWCGLFKKRTEKV